MSEAVVVDASVALKWVLTAEELSDRARLFLEDNLHERRPILAPAHLSSEVANGLYQRTRRRSLTDAEAEEALAHFLRFPIQLLSSTELYQRSFGFAGTHRLPTVYDSLYVVLAQMLQTELWTDDRRLLNTLGTQAPWVRWIGDYVSASG